MRIHPPLIILAKLDCFHLLQRLYSTLSISSEVYREVVVAGAGLPGATQVKAATWINVKSLHDPVTLAAAKKKIRLGVGELSTIILAKEMGANVVLLDDHKARQFARAERLQVRGTVGILETLYRRGHLTDLRTAFQRLLSSNVYIDRRLLNRRLQSVGLPLL